MAKTNAALQIDAKFPGGNILVDRIEGDTIWLRPDLRDTDGYWFYWCFRIQGAQGRKLTFKFDARDAVGVRGAAVSFDQGATWAWLGKQGSTRNSFSYTFPASASSVLLSMGMPYTRANWDSFINHFTATNRIQPGMLCRSKKGRNVPTLTIETAHQPARFRIVVAARHHACEMMASYEVEGIIEAASADDDLGRWYRDNAELFVIPFVDADGVEDGDQGKNRLPHDHNRDYGIAHIYPEPEAIAQHVMRCAQLAPTIVLDLHCPYLAYEIHEKIHQVGSSNPRDWSEQQLFGRLLEQNLKGSLLYDPRNDVAFGSEFNVPPKEPTGKGLSGWAATIPGVQMATTIELPYANASGTEVNQTSARLFGHDVAKALQVYCKHIETIK